MSASTALDIANGALDNLGQPHIATLTEATRDATVINSAYTGNRDLVLGMVDWVCLTQRVALTRAAKIGISAITKATPPVVTTSSTHTYVVNDLVTIEGAGGMTQVNYGMFTVQAYTSTTLTLYDVEGAAIPGLGFSTYTSGGFVYRHPGFDWAYVYDLPTDCIRPLNLLDETYHTDDTYVWEKERTWLYCNIDFAALRYLKKNTDPTSWDDDLVELMTARLAWAISPRITQDVSIQNGMHQQWLEWYARAKINNSRAQRQVKPPSDLWSRVR